MESRAFSLFAKKPSEITDLLGLDKPFQGRQVYQWLVRGACGFDEMTNLPKALRQRLADEHPSLFSSKVMTSQSDPDGAAKLALELHDGNIIECVLLTDK
ncbi:MAG: 23S rRNA (adenine(2503)-C(2))-methyltransferase RlmN, partial [Spirochaetales bacterium]|nr:23S rRNA (adenine(2503)-C(2))-methyltransferase RlmN [Spirochaetales bacterium]